MWLKYNRDLPGVLSNQFFGIYVFGGFKEGEGQMNDLWLIRPKHKANSDLLNAKKNILEYKGDSPTLSIDII